MICVLYNNTQKNARKNTKKDRKNPKKYIISMNNAFNNLCEVSNSRGRTSKNIILNNGEEATVGYYDGNKNWADISFYDINKNIAVINYGLIDENADEAIQFIKTINITENNI